jgi:hypothetical protein
MAKVAETSRLVGATGEKVKLKYKLRLNRFAHELACLLSTNGSL